MNRDDERELDDEYAEKLTPQIRPRVTGYRMPDDERDSRRAHSTKHMAPPLGVPIVPLSEERSDGDTTDPFDLFRPERVQHRRHGESAMELAAKLRAAAPDPYDLIGALAFEFIYKKDADTSANEELESRFKAFMAQQPGGAEFEHLKKSVRAWKWAVGIFLVPALGALFIALQILLSRAEHEGSLNTTVDRLKSDVQQLLLERRNIAKDSP